MTHPDTLLSLAGLRSRIECGTVPTSSSASILAFLDLAYTAIGPETMKIVRALPGLDLPT